MTRSYAAWTNVEMAPADPILGLTQTFKEDPAPEKVLLGVGAYRDGESKPYVLPSVKKAEQRVVENLTDHEYAPISGIQDFITKSIAFAYGDDCAPLKEKRIAGVQALSGTGSLRVFYELIARLPSIGGNAKPITYLPEPTWGNHVKIAKDSGVQVRRYRYLDDTMTKLDFDGMLQDLDTIEDGTSILLHACAHNPTGVDPSRDQWTAIASTLKKKQVQVFFDFAYQGFASGDPEADAWALRHFVKEGHHVALAQSYAKNFGLYGERVGALSFVCASTAEKASLESQLKALIRPMYSNPPVHGARVVAEVLGDPELKAQWFSECKLMADRIKDMRHALRSALEDDLKSSKSWAHITDQIGMFAFTGLTSDQVIKMREDYKVYCTLDGRISVAGLTPANVPFVAKAIHAVTST